MGLAQPLGLSIVALVEHIPEIGSLHAAMSPASVDPSPRNIEAMREAVYAAVDVLKAAGWPIEAIIVQIKRTGADAGLTSIHRPLGAETLLRDSVRWCIEHYCLGQ